MMHTVKLQLWLALKGLTTPAIPFLGVYLTDLTFIELGELICVTELIKPTFFFRKSEFFTGFALY